MHFSENYDGPPDEKKPKVEDLSKSSDGDHRDDHPIPRATRVINAQTFQNPPKIGHLILYQGEIDEILGMEISWNSFRKTFLRPDANLLYSRHYR